MKKIIAVVLVCVLALSFVACDNGGDTSSSASTAGTTSTNTSKPADDSSADATTSDDASSEASVDASSDASVDASSEASSDSSDVTSDPSDVTSDSSDVSGSDDPVHVVEFTNKFISWGLAANADRTKLTPTDAKSLRITNLNGDDVWAGDIAVYTSEYGSYIPMEDNDYADFAIVVFEYNADVYSYTVDSFSDIGEGDPDTAIPDDGYVAIIHKDYKEKIDAIKATASNTIFFPHGFIATEGLNASIDKKTAKVDGKISSSEYGKAVWKFENDNELVSYAQFNGDIYAEAEVYLSYDKDNLYVGVIVSTPYHENTLAPEKADQLWAYDSIQINMSSEVYGSDYMEQYWDHVNSGQKAATDKVVKQYGFGVNKEGTTLSYVWMPWQGTTESVAVVTRDDAAQKTYYEIAIPLSEIGTEEHPAGDEIGFSISINCGDGKVFKNIVLRDGGGIIGINDWSKIPVITLD